MTSRSCFLLFTFEHLHRSRHVTHSDRGLTFRILFDMQSEHQCRFCLPSTICHNLKTNFLLTAIMHFIQTKHLRNTRTKHRHIMLLVLSYNDTRLNMDCVYRLVFKSLNLIKMPVCTYHISKCSYKYLICRTRTKVSRVKARYVNLKPSLSLSAFLENHQVIALTSRGSATLS